LDAIYNKSIDFATVLIPGGFQVKINNKRVMKKLIKDDNVYFPCKGSVYFPFSGSTGKLKLHFAEVEITFALSTIKLVTIAGISSGSYGKLGG